jgi:hypothetical protein
MGDSNIPFPAHCAASSIFSAHFREGYWHPPRNDRQIGEQWQDAKVAMKEDFFALAR